MRVELPHRNSAKARRYIEARLRALFAAGSGSRQFSLALEPSVARDLEALCEDLNIPRESLLNRLFMLLGASGQFLADHFFNLVPSPLSNSDFRPDASLDDLTPLEAPPRRLLTQRWFRGGTFDVRGMALDMTLADPSSADYDKALAPLGRVESVVDDPLRWYRLMLQMSFQQQAAHFNDADNQEAAGAMDRDRWMYTIFGMPFEEEEMEGFNCCTPDLWLEHHDPSLLAIKPPRSPAPPATASVKSARQRRAK